MKVGNRICKFFLSVILGTKTANAKRGEKFDGNPMNLLIASNARTMNMFFSIKLKIYSF